MKRLSEIEKAETLLQRFEQFGSIDTQDKDRLVLRDIDELIAYYRWLLEAVKERNSWDEKTLALVEKLYALVLKEDKSELNMKTKMYLWKKPEIRRTLLVLLNHLRRMKDYHE